MNTYYNPIDIIFGSNRFIETNGIIAVRGKELLKIELGDNGRPLITVEIRDKNGNLLGKVWKSTSFVHWHKDYEPQYEYEDHAIRRLALKSKIDGKIVFEIIFHKPNVAEINGTFYVKGINFPIIATRDYLDLNTNKFIRNTIVKTRKGIEIGEDLISI